MAQREALGAKGRSPHVLLMTATPIPRTLGQILLADLDVSDLRSLPAGRQRIRTGIRRTDDLAGAARRPERAPTRCIVREVRAGHRAFVVVPLVEEDEESAARSADEVAAALPRQLAEAAARAGLPAEPAARVGVVHGQMKAAERDATMDLFRRGELDVLVGTTVLEVGVDVPEATVMLILDADRFGLAQLHQLRGRVGRGEAQSYCILVSDSDDATARARLEALVDPHRRLRAGRAGPGAAPRGRAAGPAPERPADAAHRLAAQQGGPGAWRPGRGPWRSGSWTRTAPCGPATSVWPWSCAPAGWRAWVRARYSRTA